MAVRLCLTPRKCFQCQRLHRFTSSLKTEVTFAALLVERLFDAPTRLKSNVTGRGKERLDPQIMQYVKAKAFSFYEYNPSEINGEWKKCIKSIDDKSRGLKRKISANSVAATI